ncbi:hypothetical protein [Alkalihalobacterium alkalinitrilicum]|uniref:hypothetical protein n=1 Tax=Alkalihalobacterium alkalinitrilicum TaxID=427920 RepID=UPI0013039895|nr:hypothetical protein [Alkalihalobacterium alkalinitrilicum]
MSVGGSLIQTGGYAGVLRNHPFQSDRKVEKWRAVQDQGIHRWAFPANNGIFSVKE